MSGLAKAFEQSKAATETHPLERAYIETGRDIGTSKAVRETHWLERADAGTDQDIETKRGSEEDSLAGEGRRRD